MLQFKYTRLIYVFGVNCKLKVIYKIHNWRYVFGSCAVLISGQLRMYFLALRGRACIILTVPQSEVIWPECKTSTSLFGF